MFRALATLAVIGLGVALLVPRRPIPLDDDLYSDDEDDLVDVASEDSFPASDPPSFNPGTA